MGNTRCQTNWCNYTLHSNGAKNNKDNEKKKVLRTDHNSFTWLLLFWIRYYQQKQTNVEVHPSVPQENLKNEPQILFVDNNMKNIKYCHFYPWETQHFFIQPLLLSADVEVGVLPCAAGYPQHGSPHPLRCSSGLHQCMSYETFPLSVATQTWQTQCECFVLQC